MAADRLHGDDTTVPVLTKGKTDTGRLWIYVRDDDVRRRRAAAAIFHYSRDRRGEHPQAHLAGYVGILQADAYDGYNKLYLSDRKPAPILEAACWVHARRPFSPWPTSRRTRAARPRGRRRSRCRRSPSRSCAASTRCSRSSANQRQEPRGAPRGSPRGEPALSSTISLAYMREQAAKLSRRRERVKAIQYILKRQAVLHPVPRRRAWLHVEQCRRTRAALCGSRKKILVILRFRPRRPARRSYVRSYRHLLR